MSRRTPTISPKAERLVSRVLNRADDWAFMGSAHPDEGPAIERGYKRAILDLKTYIEELEARPPTVKSFIPKEPT